MLKQLVIKRFRGHPSVNQVSGQGKGFCGGVAVAKPTGVHADSGEKSIGGSGRQRLFQRGYSFVNQPACRLGAGIDESLRSQVVLGQVMIDDCLGRGKLGEPGAERSQLIPGAGVQNKGRLGILIVFTGWLKIPQAPLRVKK